MPVSPTIQSVDLRRMVWSQVGTFQSCLHACLTREVDQDGQRAGQTLGSVARARRHSLPNHQHTPVDGSVWGEQIEDEENMGARARTGT
jgi:hypothetical protein